MSAGTPWCRVLLVRSPGPQSWLNTQELQRLLAFRSAAAAQEYLLGATGLRRLLGEVLPLAPADVPIDRTCARCGAPHGRPIVAGLHVSIAHAGGIALVAASSDPVGVDLEPTGREVPPDCGAADLADWVRKEAVLKLSGHGLRIPMAEVTVTDGRLTRWPAEPLPDLRIHDLAVGGFLAAVAAPARVSLAMAPGPSPRAP